MNIRIYMNIPIDIPGVPAGRLFLLLLLPFSKQENGSEEGSEEEELLPNMGEFFSLSLLCD
jgi:hypothetical protein